MDAGARPARRHAIRKNTALSTRGTKPLRRRRAPAPASGALFWSPLPVLRERVRVRARTAQLVRLERRVVLIRKRKRLAVRARLRLRPSPHPSPLVPDGGGKRIIPASASARA